MYKHILIAIDGSDTGDRALREGMGLAQKCQAQLRIVHAVDEVSLNWESDYGALGELRRHRQQVGLEILERAVQKARAAGIESDMKLLEVEKLGLRVADAIAAEADAWPADLVVIGSHGRRGVRRLLLGSVAEGVARIASKPVLLVRSG